MSVTRRGPCCGACPTLKRVRACGRVPVGAKDETVSGVTMRIKDGVAHYANLVTCGSTWACTVCEANISDYRSGEVSAAAAAWDRAGNSVFMLTLTFSHFLGMLLAPLLVMVANAFRSLISGRAWAGTPARSVPERMGKRGRMLPAKFYPAKPGAKERFGIAGTIRSLEVTFGLNGWHPHLHVLLFVWGDWAADGLCVCEIAGRCQDFCSCGDGCRYCVMYEYFRVRWQGITVAKGYHADDEHGVKLERCRSAAEAGRYIAKTAAGRSVGNEMARGDLKTGKKEHRTPFEILEDFRQSGVRSDLDLWHEYEKATRGHQRITWSAGLRELVDIVAADELPEEKSDEEIAAREVGGDDMLLIDSIAWRKVVRVPGLNSYLLDQGELGGVDAVIAGAARFGVHITDRGG